MANTCAICGAEVNLLQGQKLADGNYICRKNCRPKGLKAMDYVAASLPDVKDHFAQVEKGTKLWNHYFVPRKKEKGEKKLKQFGANLYVAEDIGLMALTETRYKFLIFGATVYACVYPIANLMDYDLEEESKMVDGKEEKKYFAHLYFNNTSGLSHFRYDVSGVSSWENMSKYFDKLFGIQKTLLNAGNNFKRQFQAIQSVKDGINAALNNDANVDSKVNRSFDQLDVARYGDRTKWVEKAEKALKDFAD